MKLSFPIPEVMFGTLSPSVGVMRSMASLKLSFPIPVIMFGTRCVSSRIALLAVSNIAATLPMSPPSIKPQSPELIVASPAPASSNGDDGLASSRNRKLDPLRVSPEEARSLSTGGGSLITAAGDAAGEVRAEAGETSAACLAMKSATSGGHAPLATGRRFFKLRESARARPALAPTLLFSDS